MMASATLGVVSLVPGCRSVALHSALGCGLIAPAGRILDPQSHTVSNATRCVPTLIAGQGMEGIPLRRDVACNVSVWIVSGYVGDVARYVSTRGGCGMFFR